MTKVFNKGDVVRYAEGWYTEAEKDTLAVVTEAFDDVQRAYIFTPSETSAFGGYVERVGYEMIEHGSVEDAERIAGLIHKLNIRF